MELYSYGLSGLDKNVASLLQNNLLATLCMYSQIDLGVNYYGWNIATTQKYLANLGINDSSIASEIYQAVIDDPANYLKYTLGCLEFEELRDQAKQELGDSFVLKEFHQFLLDIGPCQFSIIHSRMNEWLAEKLN